MRLRLAVVLALVLGFSSAAFAQPMISYGVTAGWSLASLSADDEELSEALSDTRQGVDIGGFVEIPINNMMSLVVAGKYAQKVAKGCFTGEEGTNVDTTVKLDYIDVPILANFPINMMSSVRPFVYVGGVPAFRVSGKQTFEGGGIEQEEDLDDDVKSFDFGLMFGGGIQFGGRYAVAADYNLGLMNVSEDDDEGVKNRQLVFRFIMSFQ